MRQALHIFRKDVRHLWWGIGLLWIVIAWAAYYAPFARSPSDGPEVQGLAQFLLVAMILLLPGRLVHAEALAGERQFWLTRPYSRGSLLGAKCLFLAVFLVLPMTISDVVLVEQADFSVTAHLAGLIWEQALRAAVLIAPAMALAAITRNAVSQIFTALGAAVVALLSEGSFSRGLEWQWLNWVYDSIAVVVVGVFAAVIIAWQYTQRRTSVARIVFGCAVALAALAPIFPVSMAGAIDAFTSPRVVDPAAIHVTLDVRSMTRLPYGGRRYLPLPLHITGVPGGLRIWADALRVEIRPAGRGVPLHMAIGLVRWDPPDEMHVDAALFVPDRALGMLKDQPVQLRITGLVTLGEDAQTEEVRWDRAAFQDTRLILSQDRRGPALLRRSYSPFPAQLLLDPIIWYGPESTAPMLLSVEEPVQHFLYHFELDNVRLADDVTAALPGR